VFAVLNPLATVVERVLGILAPRIDSRSLAVGKNCRNQRLPVTPWRFHGGF